MHHNRFCLQCSIPEEMDAWKQNRHWAGTWMSSPTHPISCCSNMALLGRRKTPQMWPPASNCPCQKQRWMKVSEWKTNISHGWVRRPNKDHLWIPRVFLPWVSGHDSVRVRRAQESSVADVEWYIVFGHFLFIAEVNKRKNRVSSTSSIEVGIVNQHHQRIKRQGTALVKTKKRKKPTCPTANISSKY